MPELHVAGRAREKEAFLFPEGRLDLPQSLLGSWAQPVWPSRWHPAASLSCPGMERGLGRVQGWTACAGSDQTCLCAALA